MLNLTPELFTASMMRSQSSSVVASGFWHRMSLPAAATSSTRSAWRLVSEVTITASTVGSSTTSWGLDLSS